MGLMEPSSSSCFVNILSERDSSAYHLALHWRPPRVGRKRKINQQATLYREWLNCVIVSDLINMVTIEWFRDDMRLNKSKSVTRCVRSSFSTHKMTLLTGWHGFQIFIAIARFVANCLRFNQKSFALDSSMQIFRLSSPISCNRRVHAAITEEKPARWLNDLRVNEITRIVLRSARRRQKSSERDAHLCFAQSVLTLFHFSTDKQICMINMRSWKFNL